MVNINKDLLPLKFHYFFFNAGTAPVVPFMPVFAKQLGFSATVVGIIYTILPITGMIIKPLFGVIADKFQRQKFLFLMFQILTALAFFSIMFIPAIPQKSNLEFHCGQATDIQYCSPKENKLDECIVEKIEESSRNATLKCEMECEIKPWIWKTICNNWNIQNSSICKKNPQNELLKFSSSMKEYKMERDKNCIEFVISKGIVDDVEATLYCPEKIRVNCSATCDNALVTELITETEIPNNKITGLYQFWLLLLFLIMSWAGMAVVVSVGDAICFEMLEDKPHLYGNQRLWGAVGWGTFSIIAGLLVDKFSKGESTKDYSVAFYLMVVLIIFDMIVSSKLRYTQNKLSTNIIKDVGAIFTSFRVVLFFLWCIVVGLCTAMVWNFLFWHLEDLASMQDGCNHQIWMKTLQGLAMGIQCFGGELPFFFLSGGILKKIGHIHAMSLVLLGFGVRFLLYSVLENPWWVLPIEFMNGVTFGIFYSTMASYASIVAAPGTEATIQGLVGAVFEGVGVSTGSFIGGLLTQKYGGSFTFRIFGIGALIFFLLHVGIQKYMESSRGKNCFKKSIIINNNEQNMRQEHQQHQQQEQTELNNTNLIVKTNLINDNGNVDCDDNDFKEIELNKNE